MYKSSTCACCAKWVDHLKQNGFAPSVHDEEGMDAIKDDLGVPAGVRSCHTALAGKYLIEGHVPAADIHRLLAEKPKVKGLAVPGMPTGTPGMAEPGATAEPFEVVSFDSAGRPLSTPATDSTMAEVVTYREEYREDFERLNRAWIEQYFVLEEADREVFRDPAVAIIHPGGQIFFVGSRTRCSAPARSSRTSRASTRSPRWRCHRRRGGRATATC